MNSKDDIAVVAVLLPPIVLCGVMLLLATIVVLYSGIDGSALFLPYFKIAVPASIIGLLCSLFIYVLLLAREGADHTTKRIREWLYRRLPLIVLPGVLLPIFLASFTIVKTGIPFIVGYEWEAFWADADRLIFGQDVWRIAHSFLGERSAPFLSWFYVMGWGIAFTLGGAIFTFWAPRAAVGVFYATMFGTWLIGGCMIAYLFSAAGPVFAHLTDPEVGGHFEELRFTLANVLDETSSIRRTQSYLERAIDSPLAVKGGGISAMPSMHIGAAFTFVLLGWRTLWVYPAIVFTLIIFISSGYFGYHYWLDGIVAAGVAWVCWVAAERFYKGADPASYSASWRRNSVA